MNVIWSYIKTSLLLASLTVVLVSLGFLLGGSQFAVIAFVIAIVMNVGMLWFSDKIALRMVSAEKLDTQRAPQLTKMTQDLAEKMAIPVAQLYVSPENQPNAFAAGRSPEHSVVCLTQGLIQHLNQDEVRGVIAHELAHIKNRDTLIATIGAVMAGAISMVGDMFFWGSLMGDEESDSPAGGGLLAMFVAPIVGLVLQMAISREREYKADETAAKATGNPLGLAHALKKIDYVANRSRSETPAPIASLYIHHVSPRGALTSLFSTHPPVEKRIQRLVALPKYV